MGKQFGTVHFHGSVGDLTGYRDKYGVDRVRKKSCLDKARLYGDEAFAASRTAWPYLAMASRAGAAIRHALQPLTQQFRDHRTTPALVGICHAYLRQHHASHAPGSFPFEGARKRLEGFAFHADESIFRYATDVEVGEPDYVRGVLGIRMGGWQIPGRGMRRSGATHLRWRVIVGALPAEPEVSRRNHIVNSPWFEIGKSEAWVCEVDFASYLPAGGHGAGSGGAAVVAVALEVAQYALEDYAVMRSVQGMNIVRVIGEARDLGLEVGRSAQLEDADAFILDVQEYLGGEGFDGVQGEEDVANCDASARGGEVVGAQSSADVGVSRQRKLLLSRARMVHRMPLRWSYSCCANSERSPSNFHSCGVHSASRNCRVISLWRSTRTKRLGKHMQSSHRVNISGLRSTSTGLMKTRGLSMWI
jgi:hypothetical protein